MTLGDSFPLVLSAARVRAEWAWARLYDELSPLVLGYLRAQRAAEPEDVAGEVFLQVVRDLPSFEGDERRFRAWVLSIAHHRLIDAARRSARRPADLVPHEELVDVAGAHDAERDALQSLTDERVRSVIASLTPDQRDVLLLRIFGELTLEEIARALGKRIGAVKQLQRRAFAQVRRSLEREQVFVGQRP